VVAERRVGDPQISGFVSSLAQQRLGPDAFKVSAVALQFFKNRDAVPSWRNVDFLVLEPARRPGEKRLQLEDGGRTMRMRLSFVKTKVYAKLDDYGPVEKWEELYDPDTVKELRETLKTRYALTIIMPEEW